MELDLEVRKKIGNEFLKNNKNYLNELMSLTDCLNEICNYFTSEMIFKMEKNSYEFKINDLKHYAEISLKEIIDQKIWAWRSNEIFCLVDKYDCFGNYYVQEYVQFSFTYSYEIQERNRKNEISEFLLSME